MYATYCLHLNIQVQKLIKPLTQNNDEGQDSEMSDSESGSVGHSTVEQKGLEFCVIVRAIA